MEIIFEKQHKSPVITDAKSLYDALERSESSTRNQAERRTAMEVTAIRRQVADAVMKPQAAWKLVEIMSAGRWTIVWDTTFQSARKL